MRSVIIYPVLLLISACSLLAQNISSKEIQWEWAQQFDVASVLSTKVDATGNLYTIGWCSNGEPNSTSTFTSNNGRIDSVRRGYRFLSKYNSSGNLQFLAGLGTRGDISIRTDFEMQFTIDINENIYIITNYVFDSGNKKNGIVIFYSRINEINTDSVSIPIHSFQAENNLGTSVIAKLNKSGSIEWIRVIQSNLVNARSNGNNDIVIRNIATDRFGNISILGNYAGLPIFYGGTSVNSPQRSNVLPPSEYSSVNLLVQYSSNGDLRWAKTIPSGLTPNLIQCDKNGNILLTGSANSSNSLIQLDSVLPGIVVRRNFFSRIAFWARYNITGQPLSIQKLDGMSITNMVVDSANNIFLTGGIVTSVDKDAIFHSSNGAIQTLTGLELNTGLYLAKYNERDQLLWYSTTRMTNSSSAYPSPTIAINKNGDCYYAQLLFGDSLIFANNTKFATNKRWFYNLLIAKYGIQGNLLEAQFSSTATVERVFAEDIGLRVDLTENIYLSSGRITGIFNKRLTYNIAKITSVQELLCKR